MMRRILAKDDTGQMLLMTGLILMFALLTMSLNTVRTASLGEPYDAQEDAVLDASAETLAAWQPLMEIVQQTCLRLEIMKLNLLKLLRIRSLMI